MTTMLQQYDNTTNIIQAIKHPARYHVRIGHSEKLATLGKYIPVSNAQKKQRTLKTACDVSESIQTSIGLKMANTLTEVKKGCIIQLINCGIQKCACQEQ